MDAHTWLQQLSDPACELVLRRCHLHRALPDWRISARTIEDHIIYAVLRGSIDATVAGRPWRWRAGMTVWVGPGVAHSAVATPGPAACFFLTRVWLGRGQSPLLAPTLPLGVETPPALLATLHELAALQTRSGDFDAWRRRWRLADCCAQLLQASEQGSGHGQGLGADQRRVLQEWVAEHLAHAPQAADLARVLELSPLVLRRRFQASYGCTPRAWLTSARLRAAADHLLESDTPIHAIAAAVGYHSVPSFTRLFAEHFGCSPAAWRARAGEGRGLGAAASDRRSAAE